VLDVERAKPVLFVKRSMGGVVGYAGVDDDVFYRDNTMILADARNMVEEIVKAIG
jgi:H+-translocating NAD(P) transhydrogenase subunit beta